jgi:hypothetical protein
MAIQKRNGSLGSDNDVLRARESVGTYRVVTRTFIEVELTNRCASALCGRAPRHSNFFRSV